MNINAVKVRRRLLKAGRCTVSNYCKKLQKQLLTKFMKAKRYFWAKKKYILYCGWLEKAIFFCETHFVVQGFKSRFVIQGIENPVRQGYIDQTPKHSPKKMFCEF